MKLEENWELKKVGMKLKENTVRRICWNEMSRELRMLKDIGMKLIENLEWRNIS